MALAPAWRRARALEQRRQTAGNALKGAGRVGRTAFTAALRRWHLVILAGDVYRGNVGRRTLWIRALPSHSYQCASPAQTAGSAAPGAHVLSASAAASSLPAKITKDAGLGLPVTPVSGTKSQQLSNQASKELAVEWTTEL